MLETAQEPVKGREREDFRQASRLAGERKSEIALSDIEKKKYEEGLDFETDVAGNIKLPPGTSPEDRGAIIQETERQIKQSKKDLAKVEADKKAGLTTPAPLLRKTTEKDEITYKIGNNTITTITFNHSLVVLLMLNHELLFTDLFLTSPSLLSLAPKSGPLLISINFGPEAINFH